MNYNSMIKKNYFINLEKSEFRRELFLKQVESLGIQNMNRFIAEDIIEYVKSNNLEYFLGDPNIYAFALSLSDYQLYNLIINDDSIADSDYVAIYEDDCVFLSNFKTDFDLIMDQLSNGFDILSLGGLIQPSEPNKNIAIGKNVIKVNTPGLFLTQAMIYKKSVLRQLAQLLSDQFNMVYENKKIHYKVVIDHVLSNNYANFDSYVCYPPITYQMNDVSLIQKDKNKFLDITLRQKKKILNNEILSKMSLKFKEECKINNLMKEYGG